jgi:hypothetical protein
VSFYPVRFGAAGRVYGERSMRSSKNFEPGGSVRQRWSKVIRSPLRTPDRRRLEGGERQLWVESRRSSTPPQPCNGATRRSRTQFAWLGQQLDPFRHRIAEHDSRAPTSAGLSILRQPLKKAGKGDRPSFKRSQALGEPSISTVIPHAENRVGRTRAGGITPGASAIQP